MNGAPLHNNFGDLIWRPLALMPDKVAIEQNDIVLTYAQLDARVRRVASMLDGFGIGRGDKVAMLMSNDYRFAECLLGILRAGAVAVPINIKLGPDTLQYIAEHSEARLLLATTDVQDKADALFDAVDGMKHYFLLDDRYEARLRNASPDFATVDVALNDVAMLMYTSGSTGRPKGCLLSHASKWFTAQSAARVFMYDEHDKALVIGPLYHANALWSSMLPMLLVGGGLAILPGFDAVPVIEAIDRYRPTYMSGTPSMYSLLLAQRDALAKHYVKSVELLLCGSAPVPEELMEAIKRTFECDVCETYGLTEAGANVMSPRWGIKKLGSTGLPVPGVTVRIVSLDDPTRDCAPGEIGELWSRGPANTVGYYKQPDVTRERLSSDNWFRTGDLMMADEQGYIYFRGRKDDMINCGGENVYPKEIETILLMHPAVADVAVVSTQHAVKGQAPVAWVVLHRGAQASEDEIKQHFLANGPAYAHPRRVFFVDVLPVSGTNKVDRKFLTEETARRIPDGLASSSRS